MLTVTDSVRRILFSQDTPLEAMRSGILNFTAYAVQIKSEVEKETWKQVKLGTIVVALTRIAQELGEIATLRPNVRIDDLKIKYPLIDISYEKTDAVVNKLLGLQEVLSVTSRNVFVMTEGASEVTIIASAELKETIKAHFEVTPKALFEDLVGITVSFDPKYLAIQNTLYSLTSAVASKRINIIELVSTYTEIMFVIEEKDRSECVEALQHHFTV
jgi:aspartokinase